MGDDRLDVTYARKLTSPRRSGGSTNSRVTGELLRVSSDLSDDSASSLSLYSFHSPNRSPLRKQSPGDRFIPRRAEEDFFTHFSLLDGSRDVKSDSAIQSADPKDDNSSLVYSSMLRARLQSPNSASRSQTNILPNFSDTVQERIRLFQYASPARPTSSTGKPPLAPLTASPNRSSNWSSPNRSASPQPKQRKISNVPYKILDAPNLLDDFYLNLADWSSTNMLAVALGSNVYLWNAFTGAVTNCYRCEESSNGPVETVSAVSWVQKGHFLAVGTSSGKVDIIDTKVCQKVRSMPGHTNRVGALCWNGSNLTSGSRDRMIITRDTIAKNPQIDMLAGHKQEVCGLKWSPDGKYLASGGNDNKLMLWHVDKSKPFFKFSEHTAAVKAIAWSPHEHGLLVSGGGTADRTLRFWSVNSETCLRVIDTGSQVCNVGWSQNVNEIVSTHGYSQNQVVVWRYPTMQRLATLTGHTTRVLYLAISPDGQNIVTGAGDETLRFWHIWPGRAKDESRDPRGTISQSGSQIR